MQFINLGTRNKGTFWEYLSALSFRDIKLPNTKFDIPLFLSVGKGIANKHCHERNIIKNNCDIAIKEINSEKYNSKYFHNLANSYLEPLKIIKKEAKSKNLKSLTNKKLANKLAIITRSIATTHPPMLQALYTTFLENFFIKEVYKVLNTEDKNNKKYLNYIVPLLLVPKKLTLIEKENYQLYLLERQYFKKFNEITKINFEKFCKQKDIKLAIKKIANKYGWFHVEYMYDPFTKKDYIELLWEQLKQEKNGLSSLSPLKIKNQVFKKQQIFFQKHQGIKRLKKVAGIFQEFIMILEQSKEVTVNGIYLSHPIFKEIASRINTNRQDMFYLILPEIIDLLKNNKKANKKLISKRKKYRAILLKDKKISIYEGKDAQKIEKTYIHKEKIKFNKKQIKGVIASPGKYSGKVTIINSIKDKNKFKNGDVLVTHDGSAELTIFLKKAGAIITNEGGMICHAAIVAREIKTPCITGTKIATKVLKDDDKVEVDANQGIIKIIDKIK